MPEISVCPVSSLVATWNVGSSSARRPSATDIFSWSDFVLGSTATLMTGSGNVIVSSRIGRSGAASVSPVMDLLDADGGGDVARVDLLDVLAVVGVHHQDAADALGAPRVDVEHARARLELARVDAEVGELADVGVGHDLERSAANGSESSAWRSAGRSSLALDRLEALDGRHVERAGQEVDDRVEQRLDALVLERGAAQHRRQLDLERRLADRGAQLARPGSRPPRGSARRARRRSARPPRAGARGRPAPPSSMSAGISSTTTSLPSSSL